jgi:enamine deaminase RidA (YjgF/YER057c/UK114 family)
MMTTTSEGRRARRLAELGIVLPKPAAALGSYVPWVKTGSLLFVSGQIALDYPGAVGGGISLEDGKRAARQAALNVIAQAASALDGDLDRVTRVVKVTGFVHAAPGFTEHADIINGASDLFTDIFGEAGRHARAAVGCNTLPRNVAVEVEAIFEFA